MPQFETYVELPVMVTFDWDEDRPEVVQIELRSDGKTFGELTKEEEAKLPQVNLEEWLSEKEMDRIEQDIVEDAREEAGL